MRAAVVHRIQFGGDQNEEDEGVCNKVWLPLAGR